MSVPSRRSGADAPERDAADSAANAARAPRPGLRERKKAATMHRIQTVALDLFEQYGFDTVSIEQVADDAGDWSSTTSTTTASLSCSSTTFSATATGRTC